MEPVMPNTNELYHYGVPGMKWGVRKMRELKGRHIIKKLEKQRKKYYKTLNNPKKLIKKQSDYTTEQIGKALEKAQVIQAYQEQQYASQLANMDTKNTISSRKEQYRAQKKKAKLEIAKMKQEVKQKKLENKMLAKGKAPQSKQKTKQEKEQNLKESANIWKTRAEKYKNIYSTLKTGKSLLDDLGLTSSSSGKTLLGSLGVGLGLKSENAEKVKKEKHSKEIANAVSKMFGTDKNEKKSEMTKAEKIISEASEKIKETKVSKIPESTWSTSSEGIKVFNNGFIGNTGVRINNIKVNDILNTSVYEIQIDKRRKGTKDFITDATFNYGSTKLNDIWK